jgi:hypothetical protein
VNKDLYRVADLQKRKRDRTMDFMGTGGRGFKGEKQKVKGKNQKTETYSFLIFAFCFLISSYFFVSESSFRRERKLSLIGVPVRSYCARS